MYILTQHNFQIADQKLNYTEFKIFYTLKITIKIFYHQ